MLMMIALAAYLYSGVQFFKMCGSLLMDSVELRTYDGYRDSIQRKVRNRKIYTDLGKMILGALFATGVVILSW